MENMKIPIFFLKGFLMAPHLLVSNVQTTWHGTWGHIFYHILSYSHKSTVLLPLPLCSQAWTGPSSPPVGRPSPSRHWRCLREVFPASSASLRAPFSRLPECPVWKCWVSGCVGWTVLMMLCLPVWIARFLRFRTVSCIFVPQHPALVGV